MPQVVVKRIGFCTCSACATYLQRMCEHYRSRLWLTHLAAARSATGGLFFAAQCDVRNAEHHAVEVLPCRRRQRVDDDGDLLGFDRIRSHDLSHLSFLRWALVRRRGSVPSETR